MAAGPRAAGSWAAGPCILPLHRDRVLFQIKQNREFLREHRCHDLGALVASLKPWVELDSSKGNAVAARFMDVDHLQVATLGQVVDLLLERRNRVWARVFIEFLSSSLKWAQQLDNEGLNAASVFIETYARHLEEMDPSSLLNFAPLQDVLVKNFDSRPELLSQSGIAVMEYLKRATAQDVRIFIWTLEEHRDHYDYCHTILDEFFEILDGDCQVMKKSDNVNENSSPVKTRNRGRKKKPKELKPEIVFSDMRGGAHNDEQYFFDDDEDTLSLFNPSDPFSVPNHLRDQVVCFESGYNPPNHNSILDNNPDPTEESLYDYFAQILEEHGPLDAEDPLLVGQLDHFPPEAQQKIQQSGGLKSLLLQSLRFILMGERVGLTKHAVSLQDTGRSLDDLDDLDILTHQNAEPPARGFSPHFTIYEPVSSLPCPYPYFITQQSSSKAVSMDCISKKEHQPHSSGTIRSGAAENTYHASLSSGSDFMDSLDLSSEVEENGLPTIDSPVKNTELRNAQAYHGDRRDVAINTENEWDFNKVAQTNRDLEERIQNMGERDLQYKRDIASMEKELEETNTNIQVTNKEVELFQQKLEEMVRRDQKEKKANQEELKALKIEIEELAGKRTGLSKSLQEKSKKYDKQLRDFCDLSNQSAMEKMSLEEEIKRCHDLCTKAAARSQKAELSVLENARKQSLYCLHKSLSDSREILLKLDEVAFRYPPQVIGEVQHRWRTCVQEAMEKICMVESQYQAQMEQVKEGMRPSLLPQISVPSAPEPPIALMFSSIQKLSFGEARNVGIRDPALSQHRADLQAQPCVPSLAQAAEVSAQAPIHLPPSQRNRPLEPQQTRFDKILEQLGNMFPDYNRQDLMKFVQKLRRANGGALKSMAFQDVINDVSQIILDHQEADYTAQPNLAGSRVRHQNGTLLSAPPPPSQVWLPVGPQKHCNTNALNMEDPCIICYEDMPTESVCVLGCRHSFHKECIKSWLKEQSTCPTCREHALLPEDFPKLGWRQNPGRPATSGLLPEDFPMLVGRRNPGGPSPSFS